MAGISLRFARSPLPPKIKSIVGGKFVFFSILSISIRILNYVAGYQLPVSFLSRVLLKNKLQIAQHPFLPTTSLQFINSSVSYFVLLTSYFVSPFSMKASLLVNALVSMGAKKIPLGLYQVCCHSFAGIRIQVSKSTH